MAVSPNLQRKLQQALGAEAAGDLVAWMQTMDPLRGEIADLRREMQVGFARIDGRMDTMQASMERMMEKGLREQTRFLFLVWSVLLVAIVGLYSRG
jgi:hypothetical protein